MERNPSDNPNQIEDMYYEFQSDWIAFRTQPHLCSERDHQGIRVEMFAPRVMSGVTFDLSIRETEELIAGLEKAKFWAETNIELQRGFD
jgi:hypothetical protein